MMVKGMRMADGLKDLPSILDDRDFRADYPGDMLDDKVAIAKRWLDGGATCGVIESYGSAWYYLGGC